jgi:hypothetical protein
MYSIPNHFSANIRQSYEKNERFKEEKDTVKYERKTGRSGLCRRYLLAQRFYDMDEKLKRLIDEGEVAGLHITINKTKGMRVNTSNIYRNLEWRKQKLKKWDPMYM